MKKDLEWIQELRFDENITNEIREALNDDEKMIELLKKHDDIGYGDKAEIIIHLSSDDKKIEAVLDNFPIGKILSEVSIAEVISSLSSDAKKITWLKDIKFQSNQSKIISSLSNDDTKIELLKNIIRDSDREEIIRSIDDDDKKIKVLNKLPWWNRKLDIILTLKSDDKKIKYLNELQDNNDKAKIIASFLDNNSKLNFLDKLSGYYNKCIILESLPTDLEYDEIKLQFLNDLCDESKNDTNIDIDYLDDLIDSLSSQEKKTQILEKFNNKEKKKMEEKEVNTIDIAKLGAEIGMEAKEQTLPNGKVVKSLVWDQENLLKAVNAVKHLSEEGKPVRITGAAPAWLVSALTHTVHPCPVGVYMPQIRKDVDIPQLAHGEANPDGEVAFKTTEKGDAVLVEYNMDLPEGITTYDENNLPKVVVPEISQGKVVYLSGKGPNYLTVAIAEAYAHTNSSVSLFQPGVGYTCSITHSRNKRLGDLTKDPLGKEEVKEQLVAQKEASKQGQVQNRDAKPKESPAID